MRLCFFLVLAVLAMTACDHPSSSGGVTGTPAIRIAGSWGYSGEVSDDQGTASCWITGTATLSQTNDQFNGTVIGQQKCTYSGDWTDDPLYGGISQGEVGGEAVRFRGMGCLHMGSASGDPVNQMGGVLTCSFSVPPGTNPRTFTGTWNASR